jgi:hypothetical protein
MLSELSSGVQFSRSSNENQLADSQSRVFRVMLNAPGEIFDIQQYCGVFIGDPHNYNTNIFCNSFDARFDGDSRMVILCTFQYQTTAGGGQGQGQGGDPKSVQPDVRPANWTTSTSLIEQPLYYWRKRSAPLAWDDDTPAQNSAGDIYDGVTKLTPITNITITQFEPTDPTRNNQYGGYINESQETLGSLVMAPHTLMFRGVSSTPVVESWGGLTYRGWTSTYDFAYKPNKTKVFAGVLELVIELGWDIAVPQTGLNVITFAPPGGADQDPFGQPLKMDDETRHVEDPLALPDGLPAAEKARAMIRIPIGQKFSQNPSASPIALNDDGTPRNHKTAAPKVLVYGYAVQPEGNLKTLLNLRTFP